MARFPPLQWVGRGGILTLALGALDVALWDIKAKAAGQPLWQLLGGTARRIAAYNTDGGWLNWPLETLVDDCRRAIEVDGFKGVKIKVGSENIGTDLKRLEAVRAALGPAVFLAVDANGRMDLPTAIRFGRHTAALGVDWFEEPLWYDDVAGHARLAQTITTPIALGEQLYQPLNFATFMDAGALHYAQPDVARLGGVTPWLEVADMAHARGFPVVSHVGDMMQTHLHTAIGHPACTMLEYIPWLRDCFTEPATAADGYFVVPREPGAGTTLRDDALLRFGVK
jgi:L-alanine-DL-glutamate epimerase-like enolase superfamily enzyme